MARETTIAFIVLETIKKRGHDGKNVKTQIYSWIPPCGVPNMKFPRRNGGEGNFYKWLPGPRRAGGLFSANRFSDSARVAALPGHTPSTHPKRCR
ncbi:jg5076 [Pararge aegeria aegeria]|uniref:Jg5076 protein n=1 Tax=Pararge aegeria aegeria TaxID=348720 RepID=A0A8S4QLJ1_9NEOP|nr:jg5076 [Pararge aegeria aegeria]